MPAFHGPLPPLEQKALLSVRLLHGCRKAPEPLNNLPAVLEGDTRAMVNYIVRNINIAYKISYIKILLLNLRSPYTHTHTHLVAVMLGRAAAVTVCGRGGRHLVATRLLCSPLCSRFCGNCRVRDHRRPTSSITWTRERYTTTNHTADSRWIEIKWSRGSILFWEIAVSRLQDLQ